MLSQNFLLDKLKNTDDICFGTWSTIYQPMLLEIIASSSIDFLIFDSEHGPWNLDQVINASIICEKNKVSPIIRVPEITRGTISRALDCGVHGVQVPNIENKEEIILIKEFSKFPPSGKRGFSPFSRASDYSSKNSSELVSKANDNLMNIIHIENRRGVQNIDVILEQDSIDIVFIGLFDLSVMLNVPGQIDHKHVLDKFTILAEKIISAKKILGSIATNKDQISFLTRNKVRYLTFSADCQLVTDVFHNTFESIKE